MGNADLHIHSTYSPDGAMSPREILVYASHEVHLDVVAITDHDTLRGSREAAELAGHYGIGVVMGSEITTRDGHLLALFIEEEIPPHRPLIETLERIGRMGGLAIVPHPGSLLANGLRVEEIVRAGTHSLASHALVGIEIFDGTQLIDARTAPLRGIAQQLGLCAVAGSDAHTPEMIGSGQVRFPGNTTADLRQALLERQVTPFVLFNPTAGHVALNWAKYRLLKGQSLLPLPWKARQRQRDGGKKFPRR